MAEGGRESMLSGHILACNCDPEHRLRRVPVGQLQRFQGNLKTLHQDQYAKLKASMESKGFFAPIFLWAGHDYILDGHQRLNVLEREQWDVDGGIPVVDIEAVDEKDAAEKLLLLSSTYGKIDPQGVYEFTELHGVPLTEFAIPDLPDFDYEAYMAGFYVDGLGESSVKRGERNLGNPQKQVKPVLYVDEIIVFEKAILLTGEVNRGKAIVKICQEYLDAHEETTKRQ